MENHKNTEIELRALIKNVKSLRKKLEKKGVIFITSHTLHDIYFCYKGYCHLKEVEMHEIGSYSLRLRKTNKDGQELITINTKTITNKGDHNAWEEHESTVDSFEETAKMLTLTEFKPFFELKKIRYHYKLDNLNIFIDDISDFGPCIEVEILTVPEETEQAKEQIFKFLKSLDINPNNIVPKSVTNIVMNQRAFKAPIRLI